MEGRHIDGSGLCTVIVIRDRQRHGWVRHPQGVAGLGVLIADDDSHTLADHISGIMTTRSTRPVWAVAATGADLLRCRTPRWTATGCGRRGMTAESPELVIAKRLLDHAKSQGFQFQRVAKGPDAALLGIRRTGEWADTVYLDGFSRDCYALRERTTSLVLPGHALVEHRSTGNALNVLNAVLTWQT